MWPFQYDGTPPPEDYRKAKHPPLPLIDGNEKAMEIKSLKDQDTLATRYTERAVEFIEKNNLAEKFPEVVKHLQALAERARHELGDNEIIGKEIRPPGRIDK